MIGKIGLLSHNSIVRINNSNISDKYGAINSTFNSLIISLNNQGINNDIALWAEYNAKINKLGTQPTGVIQELEEEGGIIR